MADASRIWGSLSNPTSPPQEKRRAFFFFYLPCASSLGLEVENSFFARAWGRPDHPRALTPVPGKAATKQQIGVRTALAFLCAGGCVPAPAFCESAGDPVLGAARGRLAGPSRDAAARPIAPPGPARLISARSGSAPPARPLPLPLEDHAEPLVGEISAGDQL